jgi:hypothetical protein
MVATKQKALTIPATAGAAIDALWALRERRKAIEKQAEEVKTQETAFEDAIFNKFKKQALEGARGKAAQASIERPVVPTLSDPAAFYKYLARTKEFDLLQQRLAVTAIRARWDDGKAVPGVTKFQKVRLHLTKVAVKK